MGFLDYKDARDSPESFSVFSLPARTFASPNLLPRFLEKL
jgi:hypothetical protein